MSSTSSISSLAVASLGMPRIGPRRELKLALESYWSGATDEKARLHALTRMLGRVRPNVIVVDTLARYAEGVEENSATEMGRVVSVVDQFAKRLGATVILVHHTARGTSHARGSVALKGALETAIRLQPRHADAHIALAAFHAEVIDKVGKLLGKTQGADTATGLKMFQQALKLNPGSAIAMIAADRQTIRRSRRKASTAIAASANAQNTKP